MKYQPKIYASALLEIPEKLLTKEAFRNFLYILRRNGDLIKLPRIVQELKKQYREKHDMKDVEIMLARENEKIVIHIQHALKLKEKPSVVIKKETLGGAVVMINDEILIDGSIQTRLQKLFHTS
ncbi:MAG: F0F1 ATP synthase subunit delta [bacterium]|nr:F0F1 ATP synthase subunit delta [bacterium]